MTGQLPAFWNQISLYVGFFDFPVVFVGILQNEIAGEFTFFLKTIYGVISAM